MQFEARTDIGILAQTESQNRAITRQRSPERRKGIIRIDDGRAVCSQAFEYLALGSGDAIHRAKPTQMSRGRIVDQRYSRLTDLCQVADLAKMVHTHFRHGEAVLLTQLQKRQRQTDVVVEIPFSRQHQIIATSRCAQDAGQHLFDCGLAVATGNRSQRNAEFSAPVGRQIAQRPPRILDQ